MENQANVIVEQDQVEVLDNSWIGQVLAVGAAIGAVTGLAAAYLLVQRSQKLGERPKLELGEGVKLGVLVLGLLRSVALIADHE